MKSIIAPIISNEEVMPNVYLLWANAPDIAGAARPGQFVMVHASENDDRILRRPLAVHRVSDKGDIALLYEVVGGGTDWLSHRRAGEVLDILGPFGNGFDVRSHHLLLVSGGVGIAPLMFLAEKAIEDGRNVTLLFGAKTAKQVYPERLLPSGLNFVAVTQDGLIERRGMVTDLLGDLAGHADQIFACGPPAMYQAMANMDMLDGRHVQVSMEARMGCGFGVCYGCTIETKTGLSRVCKEGPVFELSELLF
ncbi:MAG: dihydroorotate dehydrogenase electron transfer subunit [Chloroflexota bacterium]|nr:dihydroorotate dehydrogenase electron transfer subunit [Chloroflexota bacterium]